MFSFRLPLPMRRHRHLNWLMLDQSLVSGTNFLTGIILARVLGPGQYGEFVLLFGILLYANTFSGSLIINPMMSMAPQIANPLERADYLRGNFTLQIAVALLIALCVLFGGAVVARLSPIEALATSLNKHLLALTVLVVAFQLQDWLRRYYFTRESGRSAFLNDAVSYGGQLVLLAAIGISGSLTAEAALWLIALSSAAAFGIGVTRERLAPSLQHGIEVLRSGWRMGRDYLVSWQLQWASSTGMSMIAALMLPIETIGGIRTAQNLVGPVSLAFQVLDNYVPVRASHRYVSGGVHMLKSFLVRVGGAVGIPLVAGLAFVSLLAEPLMALVFGREYVSFAHLVVWQSLALCALFAYKMLLFYQRTRSNTPAIVRSSVFLLVLSLGSLAALLPRYGEIGLMLTFVVAPLGACLYLLRAEPAQR